MSNKLTAAAIEAYLTKMGADPGQYRGGSSHPSAKVEDGTRPAKSGFRSRENEEDIKRDIPIGIDHESEAKTSTDTLASDQPQLGLKQAPTGEDPTWETRRAKMKKDDPGSSHPARTDNEELDGKCAEDLRSWSTNDLHKAAAYLGTHICETITKQASDMTPRQSQSPQTAIDPAIAQAAGYQVAGLLTGQLKEAEVDQMVTASVDELIAQAIKQANDTADYLDGFAAAAAQKQADDAAAAMGAGGPPMGAGGPPMGAGGPPMGAGGPPAGPEAGGINPDEEAELMQLEQLLQQAGVTPEELMQALSEEAGGAGGAGGHPGAGGQPGAQDAASAMDAGGAKTAADAMAKVATMNYIREVAQRSRLRGAGKIAQAADAAVAAVTAKK